MLDFANEILCSCLLSLATTIGSSIKLRSCPRVKTQLQRRVPWTRANARLLTSAHGIVLTVPAFSSSTRLAISRSHSSSALHRQCPCRGVLRGTIPWLGPQPATLSVIRSFYVEL